MKRAWMCVGLAACWSSPPPAAPASTPPAGPAADGGTTTTVASQGPKPGAPLDGRLQVQPPGMCGGARPPMDYRPPPLKPRVGEKLVVTRGDTFDGGAPVVELTTGVDGVFSAELPPGRYCITRGQRGAKPAQGSQYVELQCLVERWATCDAVADVPVKAIVAIDIYEPCSWSVCYHGPPPP